LLGYLFKYTSPFFILLPFQVFSLLQATYARENKNRPVGKGNEKSKAFLEKKAVEMELEISSCFSGVYAVNTTLSRSMSGRASAIFQYVSLPMLTIFA